MIQAAGRGNPWINLKDGQEVPTAYAGPSDLPRLMANGQTTSLALASADFDEDGMPDLVCAYAGADGGIISLHRGNKASLLPEKTSKLAAPSSSPAPFQSEAGLFKLPASPDFLGAGDCDNDGHWDVVAASRGSNQLQLLPGNGHGGFGPVKFIPLPGTITALTVGEINRADGEADVVVGVVGASGPQALVFEGPSGALNAEPEVFALPGAATAFTLGQFDG